MTIPNSTEKIGLRYCEPGTTATPAVPAVQGLSRLTRWSFAQAAVGYLGAAGIILAVMAVDWAAVNEHAIPLTMAAMLVVFLTFFSGTVLSIVALFRWRQQWRSAAMAFVLNALGVGVVCVTVYWVLSMIAAAAVTAVQEGLGGLLELLSFLTGS